MLSPVALRHSSNAHRLSTCCPCCLAVPPPPCAHPHLHPATPPINPVALQLKEVNTELAADTNAIIQPGMRVKIPPFTEGCGEGACTGMLC